MKNAIAPSMMCVNFLKLKETLAIFEQEGIEYLHIDIMDGAFVPNFTLGTDFCKQIKAACAIRLDIHLMISEPEKKLHWFPFGEGDYVSIHVESTQNLPAAIAAVKEKGGKAMVALSPDTPAEAILPVIDILDGVLVMTVHPGFAGQKMIPETLPKITAVRALLDRCGRMDADIEVDGNVSFENAVKMKAAGANIFVTGTSAMFSPAFSLSEGIAKMRNILR